MDVLIGDSSTPLRSARNDNTKFPAISLVVSGGHTELFLMTDEKTLKWLGGTLDDAAGEAFDKTARLLGFENKGGPAIQQAAQEFIDHNSPSSPVTLPRPLMDDSLNFSFSGLKTAILREVNNYFSRHSGKPEGTHLPAGRQVQNPKQNRSWTSQDDNFINMLAFETQEAITDVLVAKTLKAAQKHNAKSILISGGVAANTRLRQKFQLSIINSQLSISLFIPPVSLCTDNAVYIAAFAYFHNQTVDWRKISAQPDLTVEV